MTTEWENKANSRCNGIFLELTLIKYYYYERHEAVINAILLFIFIVPMQYVIIIFDSISNINDDKKFQQHLMNNTAMNLYFIIKCAKKMYLK